MKMLMLCISMWKNYDFVFLQGYVLCTEGMLWFTTR